MQYGCHVWVFAQDLSQPDAAYEVFNYTLEQNITIDVLINNAGFGDFGNFWEVYAQRQTDLLSTIRNSDAIMVLDHGNIIERGNHEELLAKKGTYYQLYTGALELA